MIIRCFGPNRPLFAFEIATSKRLDQDSTYGSPMDTSFSLQTGGSGTPTTKTVWNVCYSYVVFEWKRIFHTYKKNIFSIFKFSKFGFSIIDAWDRQSSVSTSGYPKIRTSKIWNRKNIFFFRGENPLPRGKYMHIAYISHCFGCGMSPAPSFEIQARIIRWSLGALAQIGPYSPLK